MIDVTTGSDLGHGSKALLVKSFGTCRKLNVHEVGREPKADSRRPIKNQPRLAFRILAWRFPGGDARGAAELADVAYVRKNSRATLLHS